MSLNLNSQVAGDTKKNKYQLRQMNPRDVLFLAHPAVHMLDAQCDKLDKAVGQTSTVASSVTIDMPWRNFISAQFRTKFHREVPLIFYTNPNFKNTVYDGSQRATYQLDPFIRFDTTPTTGQTHRQRATASAPLK